MSITAIVFLSCYGIGILAALFRHPIFGLYTYLWAFYLSPSSHWWGNQVPDLRWLYVAVIVTAVSVVVHRKKTDRPTWYANGGAKLLIALRGLDVGAVFLVHRSRFAD